MRADRLKTRILAAGLPLALTLGTVAATADPVVYYHAGAWHAFTNKNASGQDVCGIATQNTADGRSLTLTYTIGGTQLHFEASKPTWNVPEGVQVEFNLQIDQNQPWPGQAIGHGPHISWDLDADSIRQFDSQFRGGSTLTLSFPQGNEPPWNLSLAGSTPNASTLWRCVHDLSVRDHVVTQPQNNPAQSNAAPTQPYGQAPGQPTQPFSQGAAQPNSPPPQPNQPSPGNVPLGNSASPPVPGPVPPVPPVPLAPTQPTKP